MKNIATAVYIHIPFCKTICSYCDFCKIYYNKELVYKYLKELKKEVLANYKGEKIETIYIGGGTPSSLSEEELKKLFEIIGIFKTSKNVSITFECNPIDINDKLLKCLRSFGVNRLSIGIETFNKKLLKFMNRPDVNSKKTILLCKKYFSNISIDLMYGIRQYNKKVLAKDLKNFLKLDINHLSIYCLLLEKNTMLKINNYQEEDENVQRDMYDYICSILKKHNFIHYEISNFAKLGYESKHNLVYWNNEKYYGFGLGASGYIDNKRYTNTRNLNAYLKGNYIGYQEIIDKKLQMEYEMILGLRKTEGVNSVEFKKKYKCELSKVFDTSKLSHEKENYYISEKNLYVSNSILCDFVDI